MENLQGGDNRETASKILCGFAMGGFIVSAWGLMATGVGAPVGVAALGYILSTPSLAGCFL